MAYTNPLFSKFLNPEGECYSLNIQELRLNSLLNHIIFSDAVDTLETIYNAVLSEKNIKETFLKYGKLKQLDSLKIFMECRGLLNTNAINDLGDLLFQLINIELMGDCAEYLFSSKHEKNPYMLRLNSKQFATIKGIISDILQEYPGVEANKDKLLKENIKKDLNLKMIQLIPVVEKCTRKLKKIDISESAISLLDTVEFYYENLIEISNMLECDDDDFDALQAYHLLILNSYPDEITNIKQEIQVISYDQYDKDKLKSFLQKKASDYYEVFRAFDMLDYLPPRDKRYSLSELRKGISESKNNFKNTGLDLENFLCFTD